MSRAVACDMLLAQYAEDRGVWQAEKGERMGRTGVPVLQYLR